MRGLKLFKRFFGIPVVQGEVAARAGNIPQEARLPIVRIRLKQPSPVATGPIDCYKPFFTTGLDFVLPEDYKHKCPIFCSRHPAIQKHFKGEGWPAERL